MWGGTGTGTPDSELSLRYCVAPVIGREGTAICGEVVHEDIAVTTVNVKARYDLMALDLVCWANVKGHPRSPAARLVPERSDKHDA